ncbi:hypothetical protein FQR65_LT04986 [Abscondita terminalis]|nr:hypothetical protein FQR65_LT04986 [Abscondita terminalis]
MDIIVSNFLSNSVAVFSLGTIVGASSLYCLMRKSRYLDPPTAVPMEERYEVDLKNEYRLILAVRNDLKMQKGKVGAQCGHASVAAYAKAMKLKPQTLARWMQFGGTKITVRIDSEDELLQLDKVAKSNDVLSSIVRDAGQTQVAPGTRTVIAIGPAPKSELDKITGHLKLY